MTKDQIIENSVSDAITQKPIRFTLKYEQVESVPEDIVNKYLIHKYLPFITRKVKATVDVDKVVEVEEEYEICPPTLGKMQVLSKHYLMLEIDEEAFEKKPETEAMRICESKTDIVCRIMAIATLDKRVDLLNDHKIDQRADHFKWHCSPEDFGTCLLAILTQVNYANFMISIRLTKMLRQNEASNTTGAVRVE